MLLLELRWRSIASLAADFWKLFMQDALQLELQERAIPFRREVHMPVFYKGVQLSSEYRADFVCFDSVIVELKALQKLTGVEEAQVINYLKATHREVALLLNCGAKSLEYRRFVFSKSASSA